MKPLQASLLAVALIHVPTAEAGDAPVAGIAVTNIDDQPMLETRLAAYDPDDLLLLAGITTDGNSNSLHFRAFDADTDSVTESGSHDNVATGSLFSVGDFCIIGATYAIVPFIEDFDVRVAVWNLDTDTVFVETIADSAAVNNTTTDCASVGGTQFIAAGNFDTGEIDYYQSPSFSGFSLGFSYNPAPGAVADPFGDGMRDTHTSIGENLASMYQLTTGGVRMARFDVNGTLLGDQPLFDATASLGDGRLGETDILSWEPKLWGTVNEGESIRAGYVVPGTFENDFQPLNDVATGEVLDFQGVSIEAYTLKSGDQQVAYVSNRLVLADYELDSVTNFRTVLDHPFDDAGGPTDTAWLDGTERLYQVGIALSGFRGVASAATAIAIIDPAAVATAPLSGAGPGSVPVPTTGTAALTALALLLAAVAALRLRRRARWPGPAGSR